MKTLLSAALAAIALIGTHSAWCQGTGAQPYAASVTGGPSGIQAPPGLAGWTYTLANVSINPAYTAWLLAIEVDEGTAVLQVTSPDGWTADASEPHFITWMCASSDLPAGESQTGFNAAYDRDPTSQNWSVVFNNTENPGETPVDFGAVLSPEPGSIAILLAGLAPLAAALRRPRV